MTLKPEDLKALSKPFDESRMGVKVQSLSKDKTKAMLVLYLQHTDVADRLDEVDPAWTCEITSQQQTGDYCHTRMRLTVLGVSREAVGDGDEPKGSASDALKRCAMLFGVGRYLYDAALVWVPYNEQQDKYRIWTVDDYRKGRGSGEKPNIPAAAGPAPSAPQTVAAPSDKRMTRAELGAAIMNCAKAIGMTQVKLKEYAQEDFKKPVDKLTDPEMRKLYDSLLMEAGRAGVKV